jgi:membrane-associated phospholipid phosphatase
MNFETAVVSGGYESGLDVIRAIQSIANPFLTVLMKLVTNLVSEFVFFAVILILFWQINERKAFRLGLLVIFSAWLNMLLKHVLNQPRPFHLESALGMIPESGGGFPSGHAQLAVTFLVPLAVWYTNGTFSVRSKPRLSAPVWIAAVLLILLVSFSRLYLGVHFPQDILGGWIFGGALLAVFFALERRNIPPLENPSGGNQLRYRLAAAALIPLAMIFLYPQDRVFSAVFLGFAEGYALMKTHFPFTPGNRGERAPPAAAALRIFAGFAGALIVYLGLKFILPGPDSSLYGLFRFVRYGLLGFWVSAGAPYIFLRLRLSLPENAP